MINTSGAYIYNKVSEDSQSIINMEDMKHVIVYILILMSALSAKAAPPDSLQSMAARELECSDSSLICCMMPVCSLGKVAVGTNALGWAMLVPNASVEYAFNEHFSAVLDCYYSAWNYFSHKVKFRTLSFTASGRWWFVYKYKYSFFTGVHAGVGEFNYALGGRWRYQDHGGNNPALGGGIDIGCRRWLGRGDSRWFLDFSLGIGAYSVNRDKFDNRYGGRLVSTSRRAYFGIDRLSVSLVYCLNRKMVVCGK